MATKKKLLQAAAGSAGGAALNVEDVFSTYLYKGTGATLEINNGIDLSGEGGLVWQKVRSSAGYRHFLFDTERTFNKYISSNTTDAESSLSALSSFDSDGVTLTSDGNVNGSGIDSVLWSFRKAPKFFDVVTYTGDGTTNHTIDHNLGSVPGCIMIKRTDTTSNWIVYHRGIASDAETDYLHLHLTAAAADWAGVWNDTAPTSTQFTVGDLTHVNASGGTFVAYLFAHNDGDGDFGSTADQDIIKCGSYTGTGSSGLEVDLGFEPQWVLTKRTDTSGYNWVLQDNMRSMTDVDYAWLYADLSNAEGAGAISGGFAQAQPTGYMINGTNTNVNASGGTYIYIAIRRGPMAVPDSATDVFNVQYRNQGSSGYQGYLGNPVDLWITRNKDNVQSWFVRDRFRGGNYINTDSTAAETSQTLDWSDNNVGANEVATTNTSIFSWIWRRAPSFCDVVAYHGNSTSGRTVSHNLGVTPEMIWVKNRDSPVDWWCYHKDLGNTKYVKLNTTDAAITDSTAWNNTTPTDTVITLGNSGRVNYSNDDYIAYLFASVDGVSKVGSYTGNGSTTGDAQNIDCGFSSGARFVLIKASSAAYSWMLFDTERGITSGNDSLLLLNATDAETTAFDSVDPYSSGFTAVQGPYNVNQSGVEYIFYAIA